MATRPVALVLLLTGLFIAKDYADGDMADVHSIIVDRGLVLPRDLDSRRVERLVLKTSPPAKPPSSHLYDSRNPQILHQIHNASNDCDRCKSTMCRGRTEHLATVLFS